MFYAIPISGIALKRKRLQIVGNPKHAVVIPHAFGAVQRLSVSYVSVFGMIEQQVFYSEPLASSHASFTVEWCFSYGSNISA